MDVYWYLRSDTQTCEWTLKDVGCEIRFNQPLAFFFDFAEQLYAGVQKVKGLMASGMNAAAAIAEWEKFYRENAGNMEKQQNVVVKDLFLRTEMGDIVGQLSEEPVEAEGVVSFGEVLLKGVWPPPDDRLVYNGRKLHVEAVSAHIGYLVDGKGARGPVLKGVRCKVL